jgi:hypothetical protein
VAIAVEILMPKGFGRIRLQRIEAESGANIAPFAREVVEPGSVPRIDGAAIYRELREDYQHEWTVVNTRMPDAIPAHIRYLASIESRRCLSAGSLVRTKEQ